MSATTTTCLACRGTGKLVSSLGGEPHEVTCPWCRGTGARIPGINAQEQPAEAGINAQEQPAEAQSSAASGETPADA